MTGKLGRNYTLYVQNQQHVTLKVDPPFTLEFDIQRNVLSSANHASFRVYNLNANNRNQLRLNVDNYDIEREIRLVAGYGDNLPVVFKGNLTQAWSVREGVNFITQLEAFDGGFAFKNGITAQQFPANTPQSTIIETLLASLPGVDVGAVGSYPGSITRGNSYSGTTTDLLREITGGGFFIDNGKANCLGDSECLLGEIAVISAETGLLGTPVRENTILHFDMIFEPRLVIGQQIQLISKTDKEVTQLYKVISLHHRGTISEAVCGSAITTVGLFAGTKALSTVLP